MDIIEISHKAYKEFKEYLDSCNVTDYNLRISYMGRNCSGPIFNIAAGTEGPNDVVIELNEIVFYIEQELIDEYEGFIILSNDENNGEGLEFKPIKAPDNPCIGCSSC